MLAHRVTSGSLTALLAPVSSSSATALGPDNPWAQTDRQTSTDEGQGEKKIQKLKMKSGNPGVAIPHQVTEIELTLPRL